MLLYCLKSGSLPGSVARFWGAAGLSWPRCIRGFVDSSFAFLVRSSIFDARLLLTVAPVALGSETAQAQALRSKKTISAIRRTVPSKPPPMYIDISGHCLSTASSKHVECYGVGALPYIALWEKRRSRPARWPSTQKLCAFAESFWTWPGGRLTSGMPEYAVSCARLPVLS
jgi:hypothetical protein